MKSALEIWGGIECTVNRVEDMYFDQLKYNGHGDRISDLDRFAEIGLKTLRYPFLWERIAPEGLEKADWSWADERTERLKQLGIRPIAGFLHHGSGPRDTNLLDPFFPTRLAEFAAAFAKRYPWIEDYTPVNEPCTTARFSTLNRVWYPHHQHNYGSMLRALMNECRGTVLAMREIRKVNPNAKLVATDDFGRASSTPGVAAVPEFENERRWLSYDLFCGKIDREHKLWNFFLEQGITVEELEWFQKNPCPPAIIGINHYVLSNCYQDENHRNYPENVFRGVTGQLTYADIEAVRVEGVHSATPKELLREAWERYHLPVAVTEVHIDAGREDQMRWLMEVWNAAREVREEGADIRAVTYWGLLGHYDWNCLVSKCVGYYESGVFDLRAPEPRLTRLTSVIRSLADTGDFRHPLLEIPGWWRRETRFWFPKAAIPLPKGKGSFEVSVSRSATQPLLIVGGGGKLGQAYARICEFRGIPYRLLTHKELDIADSERVQEALVQLNPWAVVNAAGFNRVEEAELNPEPCLRANLEGPRVLAEICADRKLPLLCFSSGYVFNGESKTPYKEASAVDPLNMYGRSKADAESAVLSVNPEALVIRTSAFFGPWDQNNFIFNTLRSLTRGQPVSALNDVEMSATYLPDLVHASLNLLIDQEKGIWNLANPGGITWYDLALESAKLAKLDAKKVEGISLESLSLKARRPKYTVLGSSRGVLLPSLDTSLGRYMTERQVAF